MINILLCPKHYIDGVKKRAYFYKLLRKRYNRFQALAEKASLKAWTIQTLQSNIPIDETRKIYYYKALASQLDIEATLFKHYRMPHIPTLYILFNLPNFHTSVY